MKTRHEWRTMHNLHQTGFEQVCTIMELQTLLALGDVNVLSSSIRRLLGWGPILWFQKSTFTESQPWGLVLLRGSHGLMGTQNWELQAGQTGQRVICLVHLRISPVDMLATVMGCRLLHVSFSCLLWTYFKETQSLSHTVAPVTLWQLCWMARVHG